MKIQRLRFTAWVVGLAMVFGVSSVVGTVCGFGSRRIVRWSRGGQGQGEGQAQDEAQEEEAHAWRKAREGAEGV